MTAASYKTEINQLIQDGSQEAFMRALDLASTWTQEEPGQALAYLYQGNVRKKMGINDLAVLSFQTAAQLYAQNEKGIQCIAALKMVLELDPNNAEVQEQLELMNQKHPSSPALSQPKIITLPPTPLFSALEPQALKELVSDMKHESFEPDQWICQEGDTGDCIYIIAQGEVKIRKAQNNNDYQDLATLKEGAFFGEFAYFLDQKRQASAQAQTLTQLIILEKNVLEKLTQNHPQVESVLKSFYETRVLDNLLIRSEIFQCLPAEKRLEFIKAFKIYEANENTTVILEGDKADLFYFIEHGEVEIFREKVGKKVLLARLCTGDFFGELAFLEKHRRFASVKTLTPCQFLTLDREQFERFLQDHPAFEQELQKTATKRLEGTKRSIGKTPPHI